MSPSADPRTPLSDVDLGDLVTLPDGRVLTLRSKVVLPAPAGSMAGFVLAGEMEVLLGTPDAVSAPHQLYVPSPRPPVSLSTGVEVAHGAARYWAPHLPGLSGAMGAISYRVIAVRGSVHPVVAVYRSGEPVFFVRVSEAWGENLDVTRMPRSSDTEVDVPRYSAEVIPSGMPAPARTPSLYEQFAQVSR